MGNVRCFLQFVLCSVITVCIPTAGLRAQVKIERPEAGVRVIGTGADFPELSSTNFRLAISKNQQWLAKTTDQNHLAIYDRQEKQVVSRFYLPSGFTQLAFHPRQDLLVALATRPVVRLEPTGEEEQDYIPNAQALNAAYEFVLILFSNQNGEWNKSAELRLVPEAIPSKLLPKNLEFSAFLRFTQLRFSRDGSRLAVVGSECHVIVDIEDFEFAKIVEGGHKSEETAPVFNDGILLPQHRKILRLDRNELVDLPEKLNEQLLEYTVTPADSPIANQWRYGKFENELFVEDRGFSMRLLSGYVHQPNGKVVPLEVLKDGGPYSVGISSFSPTGQFCVGILRNFQSETSHLVVWNCDTGRLIHHGEYSSRAYTFTARFLDKDLLVVFSNSRHYVLPLNDFDQVFQRILNTLPELDGSYFIGDGEVLVTPQGCLVDLHTGEWESIHKLPFREIDSCSTPDSDVLFMSTHEANQLELQQYTVKKKRTKTVATLYARNQGIARALTYLVGGEPERENWPVIELAISDDEEHDVINVLSFDTFRGVQLRTWDRNAVSLGKAVTVKKQPLFRFSRSVAAISNDGSHFSFVTATGVVLYASETPEIETKICNDLAKYLSFSHDGKLLACLTENANDPKQVTLEIFDVATGQKLLREKAEGLLFAFAADADQCVLATADPEDPVKILSTKTWEPIWQRQSGAGFRKHVLISANGKQCGFALNDGRLEVWDLEQIENH